MSIHWPSASRESALSATTNERRYIFSSLLKLAYVTAPTLYVLIVQGVNHSSRVNTGLGQCARHLLRCRAFAQHASSHSNIERFGFNY